MKFETIKAGDKVLIKTEVKTGWSGGQSFWLPKIISKVTPKQFLIGESRYKKDDGHNIGGSYGDVAAKIGENPDETKERNILVKKLNAAYEAKKIIEKLKISYNHKNLLGALNKLKEVEELLSDA